MITIINRTTTGFFLGLCLLSSLKASAATLLKTLPFNAVESIDLPLITANTKGFWDMVTFSGGHQVSCIIECTESFKIRYPNGAVISPRRIWVEESNEPRILENYFYLKFRVVAEEMGTNAYESISCYTPLGKHEVTSLEELEGDMELRLNLRKH